ncbi:MAG: metal ABC transporter ATP-binding protein [Theionarchaea archaeon]|nr:metal ABC transporter ATP-binding protein [Theionarchaea archaeon]
MIELRNVSTMYEGERIPTLSQVSVSINKGEFVAIVGPNGAGKTTFLETINGLLKSSGDISIMGMSLAEQGTEIRKRIGYVPQEFTCDTLTPFLVKDVILMGRFGKIGVFKSPTTADHELVKKTAEFLSISQLLETPVGKLSGGQLQKVMITRALATEPDILLLDEPFSNLDMKSRTTLSENLSSLNERGLTIIMVIHDRSAIPLACRRIITLEGGRIISDKSLPRVT